MARGKPERGKRRHVPKPSDDSVRKGGIVGGFKGYIKNDYTEKLFKAKEGQNRIRLLAWADGRYFGLQIMQHSNVGPKNANYLCMQREIKDGITLYNDLEEFIEQLDYKDQVTKECPICKDFYDRLRSGEKFDAIKRLRGSPRTIYFLVDRDEEEKGVQIWSAPYFKIDEEIRKRVVDPADGKVLPITDPAEGFDIYFEMAIEKTPEGDFPKYTGVQVARQSSELDLAFYDEIFDLREILIIPKEEEIAEDHFGEEGPPEDGDPTKQAEKGWEEPKKEVVQEEPGEDEPPECYGNEKEFGKYRDCDDICPEREECEKEVEKKKKPSRPTRK